MDVDEVSDLKSKSSEKKKEKEMIASTSMIQTETPPQTSPLSSQSPNITSVEKFPKSSSQSVPASEEPGTSAQTHPEELGQTVKTIVSDQTQLEPQSKTVSEPETQTEPLTESSQTQLSTEAVGACHEDTASSMFQ